MIDRGILVTKRQTRDVGHPMQRCSPVRNLRLGSYKAKYMYVAFAQGTHAS